MPEKDESTLLSKAKAVSVEGSRAKRYKRFPIQEEIELALAWLRGEIATKQVSVALGYSVTTANVLYRISSILKEAYAQGYIKIVKQTKT
jgi:hypothetical protein